MSYGWYYDGSTVQGEYPTLDATLEACVPEVAEEGMLHRLLIGPMEDASPVQYFDDEDVISLSDNGQLCAAAIVELISERHGDAVQDGRATLSASGEAKIALRRIVQSHRCAKDAARSIIEWACEYVELDPSRWCAGEPAMPLEWREGEWVCGSASEDETAAVITYAAEPGPETGHVGWCWWALGKMGDAKTLAEAKAAAECVLSAHYAEAANVRC